MDNIYNIRGHIDDKSSVINMPNNDSQSTSSVSFQFKESISMWTMTEMFRSTPDRKEQPAEPPRVPYPHRLLARGRCSCTRMRSGRGYRLTPPRCHHHHSRLHRGVASQGRTDFQLAHQTSEKIRGSIAKALAGEARCKMATSQYHCFF